MTHDQRDQAERAGQRIRGERQARGLSLRGLAEELAMDFSYLRKLEAGEQLATVSVYSRIARHLSIDLGDPLSLDHARRRAGGSRARGSRSVSRVSMARTVSRPVNHS